jgi:hypothetical protein
VVDESKVLGEMILSTEDRRFVVILTTSVVVSIEMLWSWVELAAVCTMVLPCFCGHHYSSEWSTSPASKVEMKRLFVPGPVILTFELVAAKGTRKPPVLGFLAFGGRRTF